MHFYISRVEGRGAFMSAVPAIHHETLMRFTHAAPVTPRWRVAERERIVN